jgi:cell division septation protein DedD
MKEKFDVTLDNRQIVSLLIGGIIVMGAVFVLGVVVGKKLASDVQAATAPDLLSALDQNAQTLQEVRKEQEQPLTFQDELTRKAASESVAPAPKGVARPVATKPAPAPAPAPSTSNPIDEELAALAATSSPRPMPEPEAKPAAAPPPAPAPMQQAGKEPGKVEPAPVPTRTTAPESGLNAAIARASQRPAEAVKGGAFSLQLSAFQSRAEADRFAARLRDRGYAPYIVSAEVPRKGTWYRVRMGSFPTKEAASRYLADFKRETQLSAFVAGAAE